MPEGMSISEHFYEMRTRILRISISVLIIIIFCITFGVKIYSIDLNDKLDAPTVNIPTVYPDPFNNIAIQITAFMKDTLLPNNVDLIQTAPGQAFFAQIYIAALIGMIGSIPLIVKEIYGFVKPAIEEKEKLKIGKILIPIVGLFILGISFSYMIVIPFTLDFLYKYGESIGVETFLNINEFISFALQFLLGFGIAFELPMVMYIISLSELIDYDFWKRNLRYSVIILVIFGAIITPDGSGVTMWLISGPMIALYILGMFLIKSRSKK